MFRQILHKILRSTPQRLFSAFQHTGSPGNTGSIASSAHPANEACDKTVHGALSGKYAPPQSPNATLLSSIQSTLVMAAHIFLL